MADPDWGAEDTAFPDITPDQPFGPMSSGLPPDPGPQPPAAPARPMQAMLPAAPQPNARARAGVVIVMTAIGTGIGAALGGPVGAGAGLLVTGAARNLYRAHGGLRGDEDKGEAAKALTIGLLGLAGGGYLIYRAVWGGNKSKKREED